MILQIILAWGKISYEVFLIETKKLSNTTYYYYILFKPLQSYTFLLFPSSLGISNIMLLLLHKPNKDHSFST